jgi:NAD(P)H-hydrate epimerase
MEERIEMIARLFEETGQAHHQAYAETDGADPDWPLWYAEYLLDKLPRFLEAALTRSQLVYLLVDLDNRRAKKAPGSNWPRFYARQLARRYL